MSNLSPDTIEMPYGLWRSPMEFTELLSRPSPPMYPFRHRGRLHWLQALTEEGGRVALMRRRESGECECLTPAEFSLRTTVHEYGGCCFCLLGDQIIFNNYKDGRIYRQELSPDSTPTAVTALSPGGCSVCFVDLVPLSRLDAVIAVMETTESGHEESTALVMLDLSAESSRRGESRPVVLVEGGDFYACPVVSPDQRALAWLEWDKPYMPWDQSRLVKAELAVDEVPPEIRKRRVLVDRAEQAVCQPGFLDENSLVFVSDGGGSDFWDFFRYTDNGIYKNDEIQRITSDCHGYGEAHWIFGQRRWQSISDNKLIAVASGHAGDRLVEITLDSAQAAAAPLSEEFAVCANLCANAADRELLLVARHAQREAEIRSLNVESGVSRSVYAPDSGGAHDYCRPQPIAYPTRDGQQAHAYFYAPHNRRYCAPKDSKPPLLVMVHGGPTDRATPELHPLKQFFASLGYAVLDINHRGSTGYGRAYRQSLLEQWGEIDATDIADAVKYAVEENLADPGLVFIRGGSAGGYAVLRALTRFPRMFSGGACYYGIGNLITLAQVTHKLEGCYIDRLIGEKFDADTAHNPDSRFVRRSPIFQMERLECPLILFQGLEDKVVPPAVSREVAELLEKKGIQHEYVEYPNEGHGFRRLPTRVDSLKRETAFFASIIRAKSGRAGNSPR